MYYKHGSLQHPDNTVNLASMTHTVAYSDLGLRETVTKRMTLDGTLIASTQAALKLKIAELETEYLDNAVSESGLYHDNNDASPHVLFSSSSIGGIRVTEFSYPEGTGAEYATQRKFRAVVEVVKDVAGGSGGSQFNVTTSFEESLSFSGGFQRLVALETIFGPPIIQQVAAQSTQTVVQSGSATATTGYPVFPGPLFPVANEDGSLRRQVLTSPKLVGSQYRDWKANWSYTFLLYSPGFGEPNRPLP